MDLADVPLVGRGCRAAPVGHPLAGHVAIGAQRGPRLPEQYVDLMARAWGPVRTIAAAASRRTADRWWAVVRPLGERFHRQGPHDYDAIFAESLEAVGLPGRVGRAATSDTVGRQSSARSHDTAIALVGDDVGSPVIRLPDPQGDGRLTSARSSTRFPGGDAATTVGRDRGTRHDSAVARTQAHPRWRSHHRLTASAVSGQNSALASALRALATRGSCGPITSNSSTRCARAAARSSSLVMRTASMRRPNAASTSPLAADVCRQDLLGDVGGGLAAAATAAA